MSDSSITLNQLESHLWESANILRGPVDAADFKTYIFPLLFFKRICDVWDEEYQEIVDETGDEQLAWFPESHRFQLPDMKLGSYDNYRLEAGLPEDVPFIQKTGTQLERACHVGVIEPQDATRAIVVVACAEALDEGSEAGRLFEQVGQAISQALLRADAEGN